MRSFHLPAICFKGSRVRIIALIFAFISFFIAGCNEAESKKAEPTGTAKPQQLTAEEKETIKKAISARIGEIVQGVRNKQIDSGLRPYLDIPEFRLVTPDARITNYHEMVEEQRNFERQAKESNFTTINEDFLFLENDLVMCTWKGKNEFTMKTGEKYLLDPYVGSMLFRKINNVWSIIYAHESTGPVVKQ